MRSPSLTLVDSITARLTPIGRAGLARRSELERHEAPRRARLEITTEQEASSGDLDLVRRALEGDRRALERLIGRLEFLPAFVRARSRRLSAPLPAGELEDVVQDVLLALWRKLERYNGSKPLEAWACGFAGVELVKHVERDARRSARLQPADEAAPFSAPDEEPQVDAERLHLALECVAPQDRAIVTMRHFEDLSFAEIAERTDLVLNTVKTRYYRCLVRLRDLLERTQDRERT